MQRQRTGVALVLTALCVLAYAPSLGIPLISDDYPNLWQAQNYGSPAGLSALFGDAVFRLRATSYWAMYVLWQAFHVWAPGYHLFSLALHIGNTLLVYALARAGGADCKPAAVAAGFFALHEGHQEAVMWFSAINELLMCLFGLGAVLCWISERRGARVVGVALFALALLSKESAVIFLPLMVLAAPRKTWPRLWPYALLGALAVASVMSARAYSFRFSDGSFSLSAPFWITWPRGIGRLLWIWGWAALAAIFAWSRRLPVFALCWIGIALVPYSFLTYSTQIPSRQVYLASVGLAFLVGQGFTVLAAKARPAMVAVVLAAMLVHNAGYLWTRKREQFVERAAPTEQLIALARKTDGPILVECFPLPEITARAAVELGAGKPPSTVIWQKGDVKAAAVFCYR